VKEVVILSGVRTPSGKFGGSLSEFPATDLGGMVVKEAVRRAGVPAEDISLVVMGNVLQAGVGQNPARQAALKAGLSPSLSAYTVNMVCGSGLKAVNLAAQAILLGEAEVAVAGGMESMSNAPFIVDKARWGSRLGHAKLVDVMLRDGLEDAYTGVHMGETAENVAEKYGVSREEMDAYAYRSQMRAAAATREGRFKEEILPIRVQTKDGVKIIQQDEGIREDTTMEKLTQLVPAFRKGGKVTAGNSSTINDGAAAVVIASSEYAERKGVRPMAKIVAMAEGGVEPEWVLMAPLSALENMRRRHGFGIADFDLIEINEAFAAQMVAIQKVLKIPDEKLNVNGGGIALGHPIGCSGARILVTLLYALQNRNLRRGMETLCLGGGNAVATVIENLTAL